MDPVIFLHEAYISERRVHPLDDRFRLNLSERKTLIRCGIEIVGMFLLLSSSIIAFTIRLKFRDSIPRVNNNIGRDLLLLNYALLIAFVATALFLCGFFPIKYHNNDVATMIDVPDHVEHVRVKRDEAYKPLVKKIIVMVIDALRWDFVSGPFGISAMPVTNRLIRQNSTCLMQAKSDPPTVTMPRIKAMMTGGVPSFVDVALNFGDVPVSGDSFLLQAKNHGHVINFYGDDTWLKIFPRLFGRYEGTTSFFVNDFTQVDDNVTRNLAEELESKDDWSLLILHYLGLDHIGHVAGPFSPLIEPKLREMDDIVDQIQRKIRDWNDNDLPSILVICGDHGMKDSGGHGGSTPEETLVPFLIVGMNCSSSDQQINRINQVDVASTLSLMLATPIPSSNIGSIPPILLNNLPDSTKLFVLYYNGQQILKIFKTIPDYETSDAYKYYKDAVKLHVNWLTNRKEDDSVARALILYNKALQNMKELLIRNTIDYDFHTMTVAMIFMAHIIYIVAFSDNYKRGGITGKLYRTISSIISYLILRLLWEPENFVPSLKSKNFPLNIAFFIMIVSNCHFAGNVFSSKSLKKRILDTRLRNCLFPVCMLAHIASLSSSSFVEEEHQTWYFLWTTILIFLFLNDLRQNLNGRFGFEMLLCLVIHRILRKLNSTGNKYANAPDIAHWLRDQPHNTTMTIFLLLALGLLVRISHISEDEKYKRKTLVAHVGLSVCIYLRHMATESVAIFPFYFKSSGIAEVRTFWIITMLYSLFWAYRLYRTENNAIFVKSFLRFILQLWIIVSSLLHRPHNLILLPIQVLISCIINGAWKTRENDKADISYLCIIMGNVFYFYQGNSNSLATIDVAAGYVGMDRYRPLLTGIFLSINTYSAPVLSYLILIYCNALSARSNCYIERIMSINRKLILWRFLTFAVYTIFATIQRFHLFVWTVFAPKLLYEAMHCAIMFALILAIQNALFFYSKCKRMKFI